MTDSAAHPPPARRASPARVWMGLVLGALLVLAAWAVPVHLRSLSPALLKLAAEGTPDMADLAETRLDNAQPGAAALLLAGAREAGAPGSALLGRLETALQTFAQREPVLAVWGERAGVEFVRNGVAFVR